MREQIDIETWAMVRAQQIVMQHGANLVVAAQRLDHKKTTANTYALRTAIMTSLIEAMQAPPIDAGSLMEMHAVHQA
jgi:hypothetical protein